jgi:hypothetical protein
MHFFRWLLFIGGVWLLGACAGSRGATAQGPRGFWNTNRFDRDGRARGRWRTYYDSDKTQPFTVGRYRHGRPVRTFQYYTPTGQLDHTERYGRQGFCEVTHWYPGGQVARRGQAQWVTGRNAAPRFYWFGPWTSYTPDGQVTAIRTYTDGDLTRAELYENGQLTRIETYEPRSHKLTRLELYENGQLLKAETYEKGILTGTTNAL